MKGVFISNININFGKVNVEVMQPIRITGCKKSETIIYVSDLTLTMSKSLNEVITIVGKQLFKLKYNLTSIQILTRHHQMVLPQF